MVQPKELRIDLPMQIANGVFSTTTQVWKILKASYQGDLVQVKKQIEECPELIYAQYNYTPPIHFAVREGHIELVQYLLDQGALDPTYKIYPFQESLLTIAEDRNYSDISLLLQQYLGNTAAHHYQGDNGEIHYQRTELELEFEKAVDQADLDRIEQILQEHPEFVLDETFFWSEGIMMMPAKDGNRKVLELLLKYNAKIPTVSKWAQAYYFKHYEIATFLMEQGMNPNHKSWHEVTLLHDMAQKGNIPKAKLLLDYGAAMNVIDDEYQSTPLGLAVKWGHVEMVDLLLQHGADPTKSGESWSTPLAWAKKKGHQEIENKLKT